MRRITLEGKPRAMGCAFGEAYRSEIGAFFDIRVENALRRAAEHGSRVTRDDLLRLARACLDLTERWDPESTEELVGIAEGSGREPAEILAMNGLTDLRDALAWGAAWSNVGADECTSLLIAPEASSTATSLAAQTWDLATDNAPFMVLVERRPWSGLPTLSLTTVGCLTLIGLNAAGVALGNTNICTSDARAGAMYLSTLHRAARTTSLAEAADAIEAAPRAGAHYFWLADAAAVAGLECSAERCVRLSTESGVLVHTNHPLAASIQALQMRPTSPSSVARLERAHSLASKGPQDPASLARILEDRTGAGLAICVEDVEGHNTNAGVVIEPGARRMHVCEGNPTPDAWMMVELDA